jgi:hypothetical protein
MDTSDPRATPSADDRDSESLSWTYDVDDTWPPHGARKLDANDRPDDRASGDSSPD